MKYFKVFNTENEYLEYISSDKFITPNVSTLRDCTNTWITEEIHDYSKDYFTIESLEDNNEIKLYRTNAGGNMDTLHIAASTDGGNTWKEFALDGSKENTTDITTLNQGEKVMFKYLSGATSRGSSHTKIMSTASFNVYGNVMSFVSAGDFTTATTLDWYNCPLHLLKGSGVVSAENLVLPATTLASSCYNSMFSGCTSLTAAPELPATTLASNCYQYMFQGCTSLIEAPELPATTLINNCYWQMFAGCTSLTTAPELPATTLASSCYREMFAGCTSLTTAPELSATTLSSNCYRSMFNGCTSLTTAPELPARTLADYCCYYMFAGCTSLTTAPELPATTLASSCYQYMFRDCTSLTTTPELPATTLASNCYQYMFQNCTSLTTAPELPATTLEDGCYWQMFAGCTSLTTAPELPATTLSSNCYRSMFYGCTSLTTAPELPATTLADNCYQYMFQDCTSLTTAPSVLPATTLAGNCYDSMFASCTSLTTAPELPATTLSSNCYRSMFSRCTSLTTAPELPATTLANNCYQAMFGVCTSLTTAPELPARTLVDSCYYQMFKDCNKLNYIKCLATDISASNCTNEWVYHVPNNSGCTFVKASTMEDWTRGSYGIPDKWTVRNDTYVEVTGVSISTSAATVNKGSTYILTANVLPSNAYDQVVSWSTSDSNVATVSDGVVTGVGCGDATITVKTHEKGYTATCDMSVENHVTSVDLNTYVANIGSGGTYQLVETVSPSDACDKSVSWSSSDSSIVSVDSTGLVSGVTTGSARVTVTTVDGGYSKGCDFTVKPPVHASSVTLSDTAITVNKDETYTLTATVLPIDAVDKSVTWTSSDATIATVDSNGVVSGVASGNATVTVTTTDGGYTAQCSVNVTDSPYTELEYIESTSDGGQYIDLDIMLYDELNKWYDIAIKFNAIGAGKGGGTQPTMFGCQDNTGSPWPGTFIRKDAFKNNMVGRYIGGSGKDNTLGQLGNDIELSPKDAPNMNVYSLNNSNKTHTWGTSLFCIFNNQAKTAFDRFIEARLYYFKLYSKASEKSQGVLVRDMMPCKRKSDNKVGLLDIVNNVFYVSPNGAEFVGGPEVNS